MQHTTTNHVLRIYSNSSGVFNGEIDNVSVKQVDPNDRWVLETGWTFGDNGASHNGIAGAIYQTNSSIINGKTYKLSLTVSNVTSGTLTPFIAGTNSNLSISQNGSYSVIVVAGSGARSIDMYSNASFIGTISNISVVEVQGDRPRLSYDITNGVVEDKPHLLLEPSSTNLVTFSNDYSQSTWNKLNFTANSETSLAPDGTTINGYNFGDGYLFMNLATMVNGASYTSSVYIKANKNGTIGLRKGGAGSAVEYTNCLLYTSPSPRD